MSRSCQSATFSSPTSACERTTRASPQIRSATTGLRLCGIADEPFWPRPNGSCTSPTSVRARWRISSAKKSSEDARTASAASSSAWRSRWRICVEVGAGSSPSRSHAIRSSSGSVAAYVPPAHELERPAGELEPERRRLGVDAVRASHLERLALLLRAGGDDGEGAVDSLEDQRSRLPDLERERGVDDVGGGEAVVEPAAFLAEPLRDGVDERRGVVVERRFELRHALGRRRRRALRERGGRVRRDDAQLRPRGRRGELDLEPRGELALVRPDPGHGRTGVARDHRSQSRAPRGRRSTASETPDGVTCGFPKARYSAAILSRESYRNLALKYVAALAAAAATALSVVTAATAAPTSTSLLPALAPHPALWLKLLREHPQPTPDRQPGTTVSHYEQTVSPKLLQAQGCEAAQQGRTGVAILDFGQPAYHKGHYGVNLFSGEFVANWKITEGMLGYATGYASCATSPTEVLTLARGTSNYHPDLPSAYMAGRAWARETHELTGLLAADGLSQHVVSAAGDDAEPAWDPHFHKTHDFFRGFGSLHTGETLYDYGSLDGGIGAIWSAKQALYVSGGMREAKVLPEIYSRAMAREWAELATVAQNRYRQPVRFAGVLTQVSPGCRCSLGPSLAHRVLRRELADYGADDTPVPAG